MKSLKIVFSIVCFTIAMTGFVFAESVTGSTANQSTSDSPKSVYDFKVKTIDGVEESLSIYKGKAILIVNTASRCGFTPQYKPLEMLYQDYKDKGFVVLAFPANNFLEQEPGTNEEIKQFCTFHYRTTFPLFSKISVKGNDIHPLYRYLTTESGFNGDITWNFNKFLISPDGKVVARFESKVSPLSAAITSKLDTMLPKKK